MQHLQMPISKQHEHQERQLQQLQSLRHCAVHLIACAVCLVTATCMHQGSAAALACAHHARHHALPELAGSAALQRITHHLTVCPLTGTGFWPECLCCCVCQYRDIIWATTQQPLQQQQGWQQLCLTGLAQGTCQCRSQLQPAETA
jgi:hypothetical protein